MNSQANPEIRIPLTTAGKIIEAIGLLLLVSFWYFTLSSYSQLPDIIPTHFRTNNVVDGYGNKWNIIMLPIIATILYLGLTIVARFPHKMNHLVTITEANARKQYSIITEMFRILKIAIVIVFFLIAFETVQIALGLPDVLEKWFLLIVFTLVFAPIFYFLIISSKNA
ncbi:DUF1648 domain-containing protein [Flavobacterium sangjuense]|uniref:DUF1648 domain-containing protein n=1 Tax=Flavobacterium sangjuense TaxID=2518177 RepID=A0A4P7PWG9_9FLAO|nr:DUF1648 domain-containing protein [Flavobacterium sangjuense]QBZ98662.1 hypothetical protein GS03_02171 [Flavobacterium sangjuense]